MSGDNKDNDQIEQDDKDIFGAETAEATKEELGDDPFATPDDLAGDDPFGEAQPDDLTDEPEASASNSDDEQDQSDDPFGGTDDSDAPEASSQAEDEPEPEDPFAEPATAAVETSSESEFDPNSFDADQTETVDEEDDPFAPVPELEDMSVDLEDDDFSGAEDGFDSEPEKTEKSTFPIKKVAVIAAAATLAGVGLVSFLAMNGQADRYVAPTQVAQPKPVQPVMVDDIAITPSKPASAPAMPNFEPTTQTLANIETTEIWENPAYVETTTAVNGALVSRKAGFGNSFYDEKGYQPHIAYQTKHVEVAAKAPKQQLEPRLNPRDKAAIVGKESVVSEAWVANQEKLTAMLRTQIKMIASAIDDHVNTASAAINNLQDTVNAYLTRTEKLENQVAALQAELAKLQSVAKAQSSSGRFNPESYSNKPAHMQPASYQPSTRAPAKPPGSLSANVDLGQLGVNVTPNIQSPSSQISTASVEDKREQMIQRYRLIGAISGKAWLTHKGENKMITVKEGEMLSGVGRVRKISANGTMTFHDGTTLEI